MVRSDEDLLKTSPLQSAADGVGVAITRRLMRGGSVKRDQKVVKKSKKKIKRLGHFNHNKNGLQHGHVMEA